MASEITIKVWDNWEDGIGYAIDDGEHNGLAGPATHGGFCLLGARGELRPPPMYATSDVTLNGFLEYVFVETDTSGHSYMYITDYKPSTGKGYLHKIKLSPATDWGNNLGSVEYNARIGQPTRYRGKWYFALLSSVSANMRLYELTTIAAQQDISMDTITDDGGSNYGGGHLAIVGVNQLSVYRSTGDVRILAEEDTPLSPSVGWGEAFPVADSESNPLGIASLLGLAYCYDTKGLNTFNDRGQAGIISQDLSTWEGIEGRGKQLDSWKGGLVFSHAIGLFFYTPGSLPVEIGMDSRQENLSTHPSSELTAIRGGFWGGVTTANDWIFSIYSHGHDSDHNYVMAGKTISAEGRGHGDPTEIAWHVIWTSSIPNLIQ